MLATTWVLRQHLWMTNRSPFRHLKTSTGVIRLVGVMHLGSPASRAMSGIRRTSAASRSATTPCAIGGGTWTRCW